MVVRVEEHPQQRLHYDASREDLNSTSLAHLQLHENITSTRPSFEAHEYCMVLTSSTVAAVAMPV